MHLVGFIEKKLPVTINITLCKIIIITTFKVSFL